MMSRFKKGISKSEIKKMIDAIDKNNDGRVNLEGNFSSNTIYFIDLKYQLLEFLALFKR